MMNYRILTFFLLFHIFSYDGTCNEESSFLKIRRSTDLSAINVFSELTHENGIAVILHAAEANLDKDRWKPLHAFPAKEAARAKTQIISNEIDKTFFRLVHLEMEVHPDMIWVPPGQFLLGSPNEESGRYFDEGPQKQKFIPVGFWVHKYEVTQAEFADLMEGHNPSFGYNIEAGLLAADLPVDSVTWEEAKEYCRRLNLREMKAERVPPGYEYRLPTEAEWEYVARANTSGAFSFGDSHLVDQLSEYGWWRTNSGETPMPVGQLKPNPWGLYDIHGNVFEWCLDDYDAYEEGGWVAFSGADYKVIRGGSFYCPANILRSACRIEPQIADFRNWLTGLRVFLAPKRSS